MESRKKELTQLDTTVGRSDRVKGPTRNSRHHKVIITCKNRRSIFRFHRIKVQTLSMPTVSYDHRISTRIAPVILKI